MGCVFFDSNCSSVIHHELSIINFQKNFNEKLRKRIRGVTPEVEDIFRRYAWPGNVHELRNVIERVMILEDDDLISFNDSYKSLPE
jgi:transcriptional regulator with PAS, ATPase and Fis domain